MTPIIFISAQGEEWIRATVMKEGAIDCLFKPFSCQSLQTALRAAFAVSP
jgi:FixJ family two-component response regulator